MRTVRVLSVALREAQAAKRYFYAIDPELAERFYTGFAVAVDEIVAAPEHWPKMAGAYRRRQLKHFPYSVVYRVYATSIVTHAVMHQHRQPDYWRGREADAK